MNERFAAIDAAYITPLGGGAYTLLTITSSIVASFGTIFTAQNYVIRINATKDIETTKFYLAMGGVIIGSFFVVTSILGAATGVALNNAGLTVADPDRAFPVLIMQYLPTSIGMIIILGVMSAILSTTDTRLHSIGITATRDIYDYFRPGASDERQLEISRATTVAFGLLATAIGANPPGSIFQLYNFRAVLLTTALLVPVYVALYWRGLDGRAILASMGLGAAFGVGTQLIGGSLMDIPAALLGVSVATAALVDGHYALGYNTREPNRQAGNAEVQTTDIESETTAITASNRSACQVTRLPEIPLVRRDRRSRPARRVRVAPGPSLPSRR